MKPGSQQACCMVVAVARLHNSCCRHREPPKVTSALLNSRGRELHTCNVRDHTTRMYDALVDLYRTTAELRFIRASLLSQIWPWVTDPAVPIDNSVSDNNCAQAGKGKAAQCKYKGSDLELLV